MDSLNIPRESLSEHPALPGRGVCRVRHGKMRRGKAIVAPNTQSLERNGSHFDISPRMQVVAEIDQGQCTVIEYLLSPVHKTVFEAGREW